MLISLLFGGCVWREPLPTVPQVDLKRYSGRWFEIAKYPNWFQRGCDSDTVAEYSPLPDGRIRVVNSCREKNGRIRRANAVASVVPGSHNSKFLVRFAGSPLAGDYWIIGLDEKNYSWALVGHPSRQFLWILAREPQMNPGTYANIVSLAERLGYSAKRIQKSNQTTPQ